MAATTRIAATSVVPRSRAVTSWQLWQAPRRALAVIVVTEFAALIGLAVAAPSATWRGHHFVQWAVLAGLSVVYSELSARVERMRRFLNSAGHISMTSVWAFAAVLTVPPLYSASLICFLFGYNAWQRRKVQVIRPHRVLFNTSTAIVAALTAGWVTTSVHSHLMFLGYGPATAVATIAALVVYFLTNITLVTAVIYFSVGSVALKELLPDREQFGLEFGTLVLGIFTAETLLQSAWLSPAVLVLMLLLQRSSLVSQLEVAATTDAKTGLLNATAWQELAQRQLLHAQRDDAPCAVLLLDLDHFKQVNDTVGHLAGDAALKALADALRKELRGYDAVARFGGEEFVMFLNNLDASNARQVAERTLARVRELVIYGRDGAALPVRLTASIGMSTYPEHGCDLTELLESADAALYTAKDSGRDQVREPDYGTPSRPAIVERSS
ncbi:MAG: diguanylate cyclase [Frankiales bacterium]|nr:diguanylate cyclase [Frankiales bacterium]